MNAGIYLVVHKLEESKFLIAVNGNEPFLRIENAISLKDFANGKIQKDYDVIEKITKEPTNFVFTEYSNIVKEEAPVKEIKIKVNKQDYKLFTSKDYINQNTGELKKNLVKSHIMVRYGIEDPEAERVFEMVETKYNAEDRWKNVEMKVESSTKEEISQQS